MRIFFLPGAAGNSQFWTPLSDELDGDHRLFSWPGLGKEEHDARVTDIHSLVDMVEKELTDPVNIVAQSMGGLVAVLLAMRQRHMIHKMVLCVTSAGVKMEEFGASDWRKEYRAAFPDAATWIENVQIDLTYQLKNLDIPTLLVWGNNDPISPVSVGEHLVALLPNADLRIIEGGDHDIGKTHHKDLARLVHAHFCDSKTGRNST